MNIRVPWFSSLAKINISRQYGPTISGTCFFREPNLVAKLNKIKIDIWTEGRTRQEEQNLFIRLERGPALLSD